MKRFSIPESRGFSLLELLLVLGVIAALAIAAFIVYPSVQAGNQAALESTNIATIRAGVQSLYEATNEYASLTTDVANQSRLFPASMNGGIYTAGAPITNVWGGGVTVETSTLVAGTHFDITYNDVSNAACVKMVPALSTDFEVVVLNAVTIADPQNLLGGGGVTFDPATVGANCTGTPNVLVLVSR